MNRGALVDDVPVDLSDRDHIREAWRLKAHEHVKAESRARQLEEGRKVLLSKMILKLIEAGTPTTKADKVARASDEFGKYLRTMFDAREAADDLKIEVENLNRIYYENASREANERIERRMSR